MSAGLGLESYSYSSRRIWQPWRMGLWCQESRLGDSVLWGAGFPCPLAVRPSRVSKIKSLLLPVPQVWLLRKHSKPQAPGGPLEITGDFCEANVRTWPLWLDFRPNTSGPREPGMTLQSVCLLAVLLKFHSFI